MRAFMDANVFVQVWTLDVLLMRMVETDSDAMRATIQ